MDQTLINEFLRNLLNLEGDTATQGIMQGLVLKAVCMRHQSLLCLRSRGKRLSEDSADELNRLTEALAYSHIDYYFDMEGCLTMIDTRQDPEDPMDDLLSNLDCPSFKYRRMNQRNGY